MGITSIYGLPGKGKSMFSLYYGLYISNKYEKRLVTNYELFPIPLAHYCKLMGYRWLSENLGKGIIFYVPSRLGVEPLFSIPDSIVLFDEAGIDLPARGSTHNTSKGLRDSLHKVRHSGIYVIFNSQHEKQVDSALKCLVEEEIHCSGLTRFSPKMKNEKLFYKTVHRFQPAQYQQWLSDPKVQKNPIKTKILANKSWTGFLSAADIYLFRVYKSFKPKSEMGLKPIEKEKKQQFLEYYQPSNDLPFLEPIDLIPILKGDNFFRFHRFSKLSTFLFNKAPSAYCSKVIEWDKKLSRFDKAITRFKGLNKLEKWLIIGFFAYLLTFAISLLLP